MPPLRDVLLAALLTAAFVQPYTPPAIPITVYPDAIFSAEQPYPIPPLSDLLGADDDETAANLRTWFDNNRDYLAVIWQEQNDTRLLGWLVQNIVHNAVPYGVSTVAPDLAAFTRFSWAHCGTYSHAQLILARALNLPARMLEFSDGWHGWVEIEINGRWELFDATANVWFDRSMAELLAGNVRHYRAFYSPLNDETRPDARAHMTLGYNAPLLREFMPCIGLCIQHDSDIYEE